MKVNDAAMKFFPPLPQPSQYACKSNIKERPKTSESFPERKFVNPFFFRNNPHPTRVRHIKGLDYPVCAVLDAGYRENIPPRVSWLKRRDLEKEIKQSKRNERFVPGIGLIRLNEPAWIDELKLFTKNAGIKNIPENSKKIDKGFAPAIVGPFYDQKRTRPSTQQSRCGTRQQSRQSSRQSQSHLKVMEENYVRNACPRMKPLIENGITRLANEAFNFQNEAMDNNHRYNSRDCETYVVSLLSEILQTNALDDIKKWLLDAPDKEKEIVLDMVRSLVSTDSEFREGMKEIHIKTQDDMSSDHDDVNILHHYDVNILHHDKSSDHDDVNILHHDDVNILHHDDVNILHHYDVNILHHESSLDTDGINTYNSKLKLNSNNLSDRLMENIEADLSKSKEPLVKRNRLSRQSVINDMMPLFTNNTIEDDEKEIEDIRSRLASRCSVSVFNTSARR